MAWTLLYLPLRARAEPLRMLLRHANIVVTDQIVPLAEWPTLKPTMPHKMLPVLRREENGTHGIAQISETETIARHIASSHDRTVPPPLWLLPSDPVLLGNAQLCWRETSLTSVPYRSAPWSDSTPMEARVGMCNPLLNFMPAEEALPLVPAYLEGATAWMHALEERIHGGGPFFGGGQPHFGDFNSFHIANQICTLDGGCALSGSGVAVNTWYESVAALPAVAGYLAERPQPGSGQIGKPRSLIHDYTEPHLEVWRWLGGDDSDEVRG